MDGPGNLESENVSPSTFSQLSRELNLTNHRAKQLRNEYYKPTVKDPESVNRELVDTEGRLLTLAQDYERRVNEAAVKLGLPSQIPDGFTRLYRGVQRPWNPADNLPNAFWSPKAEVASGFASMGEVWVCDVPNAELHHIPGGDLSDMEVQVPNPLSTKNAKLVIRENNLPNSKGELPPPSLRLRLTSKFGISPPKKYDKIT